MLLSKSVKWKSTTEHLFSFIILRNYIHFKKWSHKRWCVQLAVLHTAAGNSSSKPAKKTVQLFQRWKSRASGQWIVAENLKMNQNKIPAKASAYVLRGVLQIGFECYLNTILKIDCSFDWKVKSIVHWALEKKYYVTNNRFHLCICLHAQKEDATQQVPPFPRE